MNRNKKLANMAMLVALAMIFSYVESLIPINFGVPGMKLGVRYWRYRYCVYF